MPIKHIVLRGHDGHAVDPTRSNATIKAGVSGFFEVLPIGKHDAIRVTVDGIPLEGKPPRWPAQTQPGKHLVKFEQILNDAVIDTKNGEVVVVRSIRPEEPLPPDEPAVDEPVTPDEPVAQESAE